MTPDSARLGALIDALAKREWVVADGLFPRALVDGLREEARAAWADAAFRHARVGPAGDRHLMPEVRTDHVLWLDPEALTPLQAEYWVWVDALRERIRRELFLPLVDFEAHLAVYPPGAFYRRHLDQFKFVQRRLVSCILYLNPDWAEGDGGQLRIYEPDGAGGERSHDVLPEPGRFVCFRSDTVPHEVLPATRERYSLTGWMRRAG